MGVHYELLSAEGLRESGGMLPQKYLEIWNVEDAICRVNYASMNRKTKGLTKSIKPP